MNPPIKQKLIMSFKYQAFSVIQYPNIKPNVIRNAKISHNLSLKNNLYCSFSNIGKRHNTSSIKNTAIIAPNMINSIYGIYNSVTEGFTIAKYPNTSIKNTYAST